MRSFILLLLLLCQVPGKGQELYVYTEPASNMPAHSISVKLSAGYIGKQEPKNRFMQRYAPEIMVGVNKKLMMHVGTTLSSMYTERLRWESIFLYGKYRFLSNDDIHAHFRMAAFGKLAYSRNRYHFDEVSLAGDKSGVELGLIATQLWNKLALSASISNAQVLGASRGKAAVYIPSRIYQSMDYSLSAGYLLLPLNYTDYKQTNVNLYAELLAQQTLDRRSYYADLGMAVQVIFNSNTKLNMGYRFQLKGDMLRMAKKSWMLGLERTFLR